MPKRKRNTDSTAHTGPTLDHFFKKPALEPSAGPAAESSKKPDDHSLTDEQLARKLAAEWAQEDQLDNPSSNGLQQDRLGGEFVESNKSTSDELKFTDHETSDRSRKDTPEPQDSANGPLVEPPTPKKIAVPLNVEEDIQRTVENIPFDIDPLKFDPDRYKVLINKWPSGKATYSLLSRAFVLVNATRSRIKIVDTIVNFIRTLIHLDPESVLPSVWLTTNDLGPPYESNELGIGGSVLNKAVTNTSGITADALRKLWHKYGDIGDVAFDAKVKQRTLTLKKPTPLTIQNVYTTLLKISKSSGKGSQVAKQRHVERLLVDAKGEEIRYLTRTLVQNLRIGAVKTTMLIALSRAFLLSKPEDASWALPQIPSGKEDRQELFARAEEAVKQSFARRPNYDDIVPTLLRGGIDALQKECGMALHIPLKPMLGQITKDLNEMLVKLQGRNFSCEYKYDGQRGQIHCDPSGKVSIFSRHLELMTDKYPDLVSLVPKVRGDGVNSFIIEGEITAINDEGAIQPFQTLAGRDRKNVEMRSISINVCFFAFDLMYLNGEEMLSRPFRERRELLRSMFTEIPSHFTWVKSLDVTSSEVDEIRVFFKSALESKCEGIMAKVLDNSNEPANLAAEEEEAASAKKKGGRRKPLLATYEPDKRLESWLKVKKDYDSTASDTLDLVPIGGWHGMGRKAKWWSPILLAVRNPETGSFEAVCKCMSGFTDKYYAEMKEFYSEDGINASKEKKGFYECPPSLTPKVWFEPKEVWEVAFADITLSPTYSAALGLVSDDRGLSLRFPRFLRKREDKGLEEASTPEFLAELYFKQERTSGEKGKAMDDEEVDEDVVAAEEEAGDRDGVIESGIEFSAQEDVDMSNV